MGEVRLSIQTMSSALTIIYLHQMPVKTSTSPEIQCQDCRQNILAVNMMLEAIQHQMPQTEPASSDQPNRTQSSQSKMAALEVVKNGLLQTAPYPRNRASQAQVK